MAEFLSRNQVRLCYSWTVLTSIGMQKANSFFVTSAILNILFLRMIAQYCLFRRCNWTQFYVIGQ